MGVTRIRVDRPARFVATLLGLLAPSPLHATSCVVEFEPIRTSPGGGVVATGHVSLPDGASIEIVHADGTRVTVETTPPTHGPDDFAVFDDGSLVTLGERSAEDDGLGTLAAYAPGGSLRWALPLSELLPADPGARDNPCRGYTSGITALLGSVGAGDARIRLTPPSRDEILVTLTEATVTHREVPLREIEGDPHALASRGAFWLRTGRHAEGEALLRRLLARNPGLFDVANVLARHLHLTGSGDAALALRRDLAARLPLSADLRAEDWGDALLTHQMLVHELESAGEHRGALEAIEALLRAAEDPRRPPSRTLEYYRETRQRILDALGEAEAEDLPPGVTPEAP